MLEMAVRMRGMTQETAVRIRELTRETAARTRERAAQHRIMALEAVTLGETVRGAAEVEALEEAAQGAAEVEVLEEAVQGAAEVEVPAEARAAPGRKEAARMEKTEIRTAGQMGTQGLRVRTA